MSLILVHRKANDKPIEMIVNASHISRLEMVYLGYDSYTLCMFMDDGQSFFLTETMEEVKTMIFGKTNG